MKVRSTGLERERESQYVQLLPRFKVMRTNAASSRYDESKTWLSNRHGRKLHGNWAHSIKFCLPLSGNCRVCMWPQLGKIESRVFARDCLSLSFSTLSVTYCDLAAPSLILTCAVKMSGATCAATIGNNAAVVHSSAAAQPRETQASSKIMINFLRRALPCPRFLLLPLLFFH